MYRVTMVVHHGHTYEAQGEGRTVSDALADVLSTELGVGYGPTGANRTKVYGALAHDGHTKLGWADYVAEEIWHG